MNAPKIALVFDWLTSNGGAEQQLLALHELYPEAPIYTALYHAPAVPRFAKATVIPSYLQKLPGASTRHQVMVPLMPQAFESFDLKGYDLVFSIGQGLSKGIITQPGQPHVAYINTPPRYLWHLGEDNRNKGRLDSGLRAWAEHRLRIWDVVSAERPDSFYGNSQNVVNRIEKIYRRPAEILFPPVDTNRFSLGTAKRGDFFLSVGRLIQYKRIDLIIEACIKTRQPLKIVGKGPEEVRLRKLAQDAPWVEFLGFQSEEDLEKLYQTAKAFVFAAEEDFGIVPVEAMSAGCPVIAYGKGGVQETVVDGKTGTLFQEQTITCLAETLASFKPENYAPETLRTQAEKFSTKLFKEHVSTIIAKHL